MTSPIHFTNCQVRNKVAPENESAAKRLQLAAYQTGFNAGEAVTRRDMAVDYQWRLERAIFIALTFGLILGAVLTVVFGPVVAGALS